MKLTSVIEEIERFQAEDSELTKRKKFVVSQMLKLGTALKSAMSHLSEPGVGRIEFQSGDKQYAIDSSGVLTRINEVEQIDETIEIEVEE